ncbi:BFO_1060 family glycosyltransferase [Plebeiibacterium marinum]|uniref:Uncharacterized protein n=1 Tax=Plebeiibacterium marinum TaxID=2992111 RepID=A0AAE3MGB3_9BACT|nr:hypothetical protein [Plebeiobacterium marinum]MCW3807468.1 hypothetical protein [Plebeiobacterium marinum]
MIDILNLEWYSGARRDNYISTLICNYLNLCGYNVLRGCIFEGKQLIYKNRPRIVFLANGIGAPENISIVKFAKSFGCMVITGTSEGNIKEFAVEQMFWGWNKKKILIEDINLQWTFRAKKLITTQYPHLEQYIKVCGGIGFDLYKLKSNTKKVKRLVKDGLNIPKNKPLIGFACWDFGILYPQDHRFKITKKHYSQDQIIRFQEDGKKLNKILYSIINSNPQYYFLIKEHPGSLLGDKASAIEGLRGLDNVIILKNEESIENCIKASDIWLGYETTTCLEAWLCGLNTILINPSGSDFKRDQLYKGSVIVNTYKDLNAILKKFFSSPTQTLPEFQSLANVRTREIENVIQWTDGLNHKRAGDYIVELLKNGKNNLNSYRPDILYQVIKEFAINNKLLGSIINKGRHAFVANKLKAFSHYELNSLEKELMIYQKQLY